MKEWNLFEACLWLAFAAIFGIKAALPRTSQRRTCTLIALALVVFAASDLIEAQTGAWWRPWWLALLKGACLSVLAVSLRKLIRGRR